MKVIVVFKWSRDPVDPLAKISKNCEYGILGHLDKVVPKPISVIRRAG